MSTPSSNAAAEEKPKAVEEKKYLQLTRESIKMYAGCAGHAELSDSVAAMLAEDVNYRLREAAQNAAQFMRHAKRKKLCSEHFNSGLRWSDAEPLYGHSNPEPLNTIFVKEADVFCTEDKEVNVVNMAMAHTSYELPGAPGIKGEWKTIEKIVKGNVPPTAPGNKKPSVQVPIELMTYYDRITQAILGNNESLFKVALNDLGSNSKIAPLLPYLINFVSVGIKKMSHDLTQLSKLLNTVSALVSNPTLDLNPRPYMDYLLQSLLYCILEPLAASINPINDHWTLRESAAKLLALIVKRWKLAVSKLLPGTLIQLRDSFKDLSKPFCCHYGAIVTMMALGIKVVETFLYPYIANYWPHLITALEDRHYTNAQIKTDAQKVHGMLLLAAELLIWQQHKQLKASLESPSAGTSPPPASFLCEFSDVQGLTENKRALESLRESADAKRESMRPATAIPAHPQPRRSTGEMYAELYEYFGDALSLRLPHVDLRGAAYQPKEEPLVQLFSGPELQQSGEELLEAFYERDRDLEEPHSNSMDDDNSYDERDDNSVLSEDHEADPVDLQIKSTISDPTLGIKLTIAKLRRTKPPPEEPKAAKKRKLTIRAPRETEPLFEYVPLRPPNVPMEFNFVGAKPIPQQSLRRRQTPAEFQTFPAGTPRTPYAMMCLRNRTGKKRKVDRKLVWQLRFATANLATVL